MNSRGLTITLLVCSLAWAVRGCAIVPWEPRETMPRPPPSPNVTAQKAEQSSHPKQKVASGNTTAKGVQVPSGAKPMLQQPSPEPGPEPKVQSSPTSRPSLNPDATGGWDQETRPVQTPEPKLETGPDRAEHQRAPEPAPGSVPEPVAEPKLSPEPLPELASEPAQAPRTLQPVQEPTTSGAPATTSPTTPDPAGETASIPEPSSLESTLESRTSPLALEAPLIPPSIFSPKPIAQTPQIILPRANSSDHRFDEVFGFGRPSEMRIPRLLREPAPPLLLPENGTE